MKLDAKTKKPYAFAMRDALPFAFAGLWDGWNDPASAEWLHKGRYVEDCLRSC